MFRMSGFVLKQNITLAPPPLPPLRASQEQSLGIPMSHCFAHQAHALLPLTDIRSAGDPCESMWSWSMGSSRTVCTTRGNLLNDLDTLSKQGRCYSCTAVPLSRDTHWLIPTIGDTMEDWEKIDAAKHFDIEAQISRIRVPRKVR